MTSELYVEPVYFNTKFIYDCYTWDLPDFGAESDSLIDILTVTWTRDNIPMIQTFLSEKRSIHGYPEIDVLGYPKNINGTREIVDFFESVDGVSTVYVAAYVIWHQLLYQDPLEAVYESGRPPNYFDELLSASEAKNGKTGV